MNKFGRNVDARILGIALVLLITACGKTPEKEETCKSGNCTEQSINAPVSPPPGDSAEPLPPTEPIPPPVDPIPPPSQEFQFPAFSSAWGLHQKLYAKALLRQRSLQRKVGNPRYFVIVDFSLPSNRKRLFLFDLSKGTVERYLTSHGSGSDPRNSGFANSFSNEPNSKKSSLGLYLTLNVYYGQHGRSLRLRGLDPSNSNAEERAIVMHPADYVSEARSYAGRSWGCTALDPAVADRVINRIQGGALMLVDRD